MKCSLSWICPVFSYASEQVSDVTLSEKIGLPLLVKVRNKQCLQLRRWSLSPMKIVHHHANCRFDELISGHQSANPSREATSILSEKYRRLKFIHPVIMRSSIHFYVVARGFHTSFSKQLVASMQANSLQ